MLYRLTRDDDTIWLLLLSIFLPTILGCLLYGLDDWDRMIFAFELALEF